MPELQLALEERPQGSWEASCPAVLAGAPDSPVRLLPRFDRMLGGLEMELRLRDHLAKLFNKQHPSKDVRKNLRAMAKLLKEASRLKTVLSANADHMAQVGCVGRG